ncbi:MAG: LysE family translocator [Geminicoccaceae bacterium]
MADYLPQLILAWSIQLMGVVSPGPGIMLILGVATSQGRLPSLITAFGIACASIILSMTTVLGITAIFAKMADLMTVIRLVGAAYLLWLAYRAFRNMAAPPDLDLHQRPRINPWRAGLAGFGLQLSNPKAIFFWLAIASVGGIGDAPPIVIFVFVAGAFVNSFVGHGGYALLLSSKPIRHVYLRFHRWVDGTMGCFFLFASFKLATARE